MEYFLLKPQSGELTGTFSIEQVRDMLSKGVLDPDTRYWHEGIPEWRPVDQIEESLHFQPSATTSPPSGPSHPPVFAPTSRAVVRPDPAQQQRSFKLPPETKKPAEFVPSIVTLPPIRRDEVPVPDPPPAVVEPVAAIRARGNAFIGWLVYILNVTVVALAIDYAGPAMHYLAQLHQTNVTLTSSDTYAIVDQSAIKPFADDLRNSPAADSLQQKIDKTTDPFALSSLKIGLEKENARHIEEVKQRYLSMGKAEIIQPGAYRLIDYKDDKGVSVSPQAGNPFLIAILYKDQTVYAWKNPSGK